MKLTSHLDLQSRVSSSHAEDKLYFHSVLSKLVLYRTVASSMLSIWSGHPEEYSEGCNTSGDVIQQKSDWAISTSICLVRAIQFRVENVHVVIWCLKIRL
jgi:hypothetical protein